MCLSVHMACEKYTLKCVQKHILVSAVPMLTPNLKLVEVGCVVLDTLVAPGLNVGLLCNICIC